MNETQISWWHYEDQEAPFYAPACEERRIFAAFPEHKRIMVFCQWRAPVGKFKPMTYEALERLGAVDSVRHADLVLDMLPAGFVYVAKDRFGNAGRLRSIWQKPRGGFTVPTAPAQPQPAFFDDSETA